MELNGNRIAYRKMILNNIQLNKMEYIGNNEVIYIK